MLFLVTSKEPRPHGPWHTPARHAGCLAHWVGVHMEGVCTIHPIMFVRGYAIYVETDSGRRLREILEGNPMWPDETYRIYVLEENGPVKNEPVPEGKQRFLILARPAKPAAARPRLCRHRRDAGTHRRRARRDGPPPG